MTTKLLLSFMLLLPALIAQSQDSFLNSPDAYLSKTPPGNKPEIFIPHSHARLAIAPDGKTIFYDASDNGDYYNIRYYKYFNRKWNGPIKLFSNFIAPTFSKDGDTLFTMKYGTDSDPAYRSYFSLKTDSSWTIPTLVNKSELYYLQESNLGNYYCGSDKVAGGFGQWDLYKSQIINGNVSYQNMGIPLNTTNNDVEFFMAKDESYIVLGANEGGPGGRDLYISYKKSNGTWTNPKSLGNLINDGNFYKWGPVVSADNKYLFYSRDTANGDFSHVAIYWVQFDRLCDSLKKTNYIPYVRNKIANRYDSVNYKFTFQIPDSTFIDDDGNTTLSFSANLKNGDPLPSWLKFDASNRTFTGIAKEAGTYYIKVTATDTAKAGVSSLFNLFIKGNLSSVNDSENENIQLFPNPTSGKLTVIFDKYEVEQTVLKIFNQEGIAVFSKMYLNSKLAIVDLSSYPKGFYTVLFTNKMKSYRKQICMQ